jgi:hypothetical protein
MNMHKSYHILNLLHTIILEADNYKNQHPKKYNTNKYSKHAGLLCINNICIPRFYYYCAQL